MAPLHLRLMNLEAKYPRLWKLFSAATDRKITMEELKEFLSSWRKLSTEERRKYKEIYGVVVFFTKDLRKENRGK